MVPTWLQNSEDKLHNSIFKSVSHGATTPGKNLSGGLRVRSYLYQKRNCICNTVSPVMSGSTQRTNTAWLLGKHCSQRPPLGCYGRVYVQMVLLIAREFPACCCPGSEVVLSAFCTGIICENPTRISLQSLCNRSLQASALTNDGFQQSRCIELACDNLIPHSELAFVCL